MTDLLKPTRKPRVYREDPVETLHEDGHAWAVSYADFLMVLLSFFVIFFSIDDQKRDNLFQKLAVTGKPVDQKFAANKNDRLPQGVNSALTNLDGLYVSRPDEKEKLYIYFEDNIYLPGQLDLSPPQIEKLKGILTQLEPYMKEISITFIGHTDSSTVSVSKNRFISDNFDLSSLRATKALQQAVKAGFDANQMFAKGVASHSRGSRTLSLVVSPSLEDQ